MKSILMKSLPHVAAVVLFLVLSSLFFSLENKDYGLRQSDIEHVMGMSKELVDYRMMHNGEEALWSNNMFGGLPAYQTNVLYPSNLLKGIDQLIKLYQDPATGTLFMCMLGFYIFALCVGINPWLGIVGGIAFGLSTINVLYLGAGHTSKVNAISYMAPVLGGMILAFRGRWLLGSAIFALFFGLHIAASHLQMTYYLAFLLGAVAIGEVIRLVLKKEIKQGLVASGALVFAAILGVLPNLGSLLTTYEYSKLTTRGTSELTIQPQDINPALAPDPSEAESEEEAAAGSKGLKPSYILQYNMSGREWMATFLPNAKGGASAYIKSDKEAMRTVPAALREQVGDMNHYWGDQDASGGAFYFGAFMMFLFIVALIFAKDSIKWPFLVISLLAIALSVKELTGINQFFIDSVPYYNKFRDHKMMLVLMQLMAPALGILFIHELIQKEITTQARKWMLIGTAGVLLVGLAISFIPSAAGSLLSSRDEEMFQGLDEQYAGDPKVLDQIESVKTALTDVRAFIYKEDGTRTAMLFIAAALLLLTLYFKKAPWWAAVAFAAMVVVGDMWTVSSRYINEEKVGGNYTDYVKKSEKYFPFEADQCDLIILEKEKANVKDFDAQVKELSNAYQQHPTFKDIKDKNLHETAAQFGVLGLNTDYRVLLASRGVFADASIPYFHKSIGGYHAAKLKRYQEMIDFYLNYELGQFTVALQGRNIAAIDSTISTLKVMNMLNTRYIKFSPEAPPIDNKFNQGPAWFVSNIKVVPTENDEMKSIGELDTRSEAVVHSSFQGVAKAQQVDSTSTVVLEEYATKYLKYKSNSPSGGAIVFSEVYYPEGWICSIDGNPTEYFRANYFLRGVSVPAGEHTIEWTFAPSSYFKGVTMNWIGSFSLLGFVLLVFGIQIRSELKKPQAA